MSVDIMDLSEIGKTIDGTSLAFLRLDCVGKGVDSIEILEQYPDLQQIDLSRNKIGDVAPLALLPFVLKLSLVGNEIKNLEPWGEQFLVHLMHLDVSENQLTKLPPLAMPALRTARFAANLITTCSGFGGHAKLEQLDLSKNKLLAVCGLANMPTLQRLNVAQNAISGLGGLTGLASLRELDVSLNQLEVLDGPWDGAANIEVLNASSNKFGAAAEPTEEGGDPGPSPAAEDVVGGIRALAKLRTLRVEASPISEVGDIRLELLIVHPQLKDIDGTEVEDEEREKAAELHETRLEEQRQREEAERAKAAEAEEEEE